jgi:4-hydroxy-tetrahydrodipicolinate synthase
MTGVELTEAEMTRDVKLICATIVPFTLDGELDVAGMPTLFRSIYDSGIRFVFTPGTTGEFTGLSDDERIKVIDAALAVFGAEGVYAHVGAATARQAVRLAKRAYESGATKLAAITPYFVKAGPRSVTEYYRALTEAVPDAEVYVYIFRDRASTNVEPEELGALSEIPGIAGAKVSGLSTAEAIAYRQFVPEAFPIFSGNDRELIRFVQAGGAGGVSGISGVFPDPFVRTARALAEGTDLTGLQEEIDRVVDLTAGGDFAMLKVGIAARGLPAGPLRIANDTPDESLVDALRTAVEGIQHTSSLAS